VSQNVVKMLHNSTKITFERLTVRMTLKVSPAKFGADWSNRCQDMTL